jgi:hypothetical protein
MVWLCNEFSGGRNAGLDAACRGDSLGQHRTGNLTWECFHGIFIVYGHFIIIIKFFVFGGETLLPTEPNTPTEGNPILKIYTVLLVHTIRKSLSTQ